MILCKEVLILVIGLCILPNYAHPNRRGNAQNTNALRNTRFIDLSHAFNNETVTWPGRKITFFTEIEGRTGNGNWIASYGFCTSEHTSTHIDAPYHFNENGRRLHEIPFEDLIDVPGVMIDIYDKVHKFQDGELKIIENYGLTRLDILEWEQTNGKIPQGAVVLLRSGWESRWGNKRLFRGAKRSHATPQPVSDADNDLDPTSKFGSFSDPGAADEMADLNSPGFGATAATFLAVERGVRGVGTDTLSVDTGNSALAEAHVTFASRNIYMLEMVASLHQLPPRGFNLWIVPFKIDRGTGAPTRVVARINEDT